MTPTKEQQTAADKVIQAAQIMQKCMRDAQRLGLTVNISVYHYEKSPHEVSASVSLVEETEVARSPKGKS